MAVKQYAFHYEFMNEFATLRAHPLLCRLTAAIVLQQYCSTIIAAGNSIPNRNSTEYDKLWTAITMITHWSRFASCSDVAKYVPLIAPHLLHHIKNFSAIQDSLKGQYVFKILASLSSNTEALPLLLETLFAPLILNHMESVINASDRYFDDVDIH